MQNKRISDSRKTEKKKKKEREREREKEKSPIMAENALTNSRFTFLHIYIYFFLNS